jgi:hypothetical protein
MEDLMEDELNSSSSTSKNFHDEDKFSFKFYCLIKGEALLCLFCVCTMPSAHGERKKILTSCGRTFFRKSNHLRKINAPFKYNNNIYLRWGVI